MIQELMTRHGATFWPVVFLVGSLAVYLAVLVSLWLRPGGKDGFDHVAALPLADDTGTESDFEGRDA